MAIFPNAYAKDLQNAGAAAQKVSRVVVGVKANQITMQDAEQNFVANRENTVDLRAGERRVQEEAKLDVLLLVTNLLAQHGGQEHEVVIVHPYHIVVLDISGDGLCEQAVGFGVCVPCGLVEGDLAWVVVEQRPEDGVCRLACYAIAPAQDDLLEKPL
jgi:hypothetical protein